jgi:hypothetical protein
LLAAVASVVGFGAGTRGINNAGMTPTAVDRAPASVTPLIGTHAVASRIPGLVKVGPNR